MSQILLNDQKLETLGALCYDADATSTGRKYLPGLLGLPQLLHTFVPRQSALKPALRLSTVNAPFMSLHCDLIQG